MRFAPGYGQTKPPPGSQVLWGHPLARGLLSAWLMSEGGGKVTQNLKQAGIGTFSGTVSHAVRSKGRGIEFPTNGGITISPSCVNLNEGTVVLYHIPDFAPADVRADGPYWFDTDSARHAFYKKAGGGYQMYNDGRTTDFTAGWAAGDVLSLAFLYRKTGNLQQVWVNGRQQTGITGGEVWGATALGTNAYIGMRTGSISGFDGFMMYCLTYDRLLLPVELAQLAAEPYAMIASPASRRYWFLAEEAAASDGKGIMHPYTGVA